MNGQVEYRDTLLKVEGVCVELAGKTVLRDVSFEVKDIVRPGCITGQVVGLLGPSGIGKTQLLRVLAGLAKPSAGRVRVEKAQRNVEAGMVGLVGQRSPLLEHRTVRGNLVVAGRQAGLDGGAALEKARALLSRFGLLQKEERYPAELSGGERQRVAIAQQFMCSEHFLLMDEPFSGLDPVATDEVCRLITEVASLDTLNTIVVVTHDVAAAVAVADTLHLLGREKDGEGRVREGARIVATYDLVARGLAWRADVTSLPEFRQLVEEIRRRFWSCGG